MYSDDFISKTYAAAFDSIAIIETLSAKPDKTATDIIILERNVKHLEIILSKTFWTNEDLAPLSAAVILGKQ